jgi:hypothetical protein
MLGLVHILFNKLMSRRLLFCLQPVLLHSTLRSVFPIFHFCGSVLFVVLAGRPESREF